jgi:hypothetical protein
MLYGKRAVSSCSCPECKGQMKEEERRRENGALFIWFKCHRPECHGQWLKKIPLIKNRPPVDDRQDVCERGYYAS